MEESMYRSTRQRGGATHGKKQHKPCTQGVCRALNPVQQSGKYRALDGQAVVGEGDVRFGDHVSTAV